MSWNMQNNWYYFKSHFPLGVFLPFPEIPQKCHLALIRCKKKSNPLSSAHQHSPAEILIDVGPCLAPSGSQEGPRGSVQTDGKEDGVGHRDSRAASGGLRAAVVLIDTRDGALWCWAESKTKKYSATKQSPGSFGSQMEPLYRCDRSRMFAVVSLELEVSQETDKQQLALSSIFTEEYCNPAVRLKFFILRLHHSVFVIASCLIPVNSVKLSVNKSSSLQMFVSEPLLRSLKPTCALS